MSVARAALLSAVLAWGGPAAAAGPVVLFDAGHGQPFRVDGGGPLDLSSLGRSVGEAGGRVEALRAPLSAGALSGARALVVSGAFAAVTPAEEEAVLAFLERGGRLAVMLHIGPPVASLLERLGVAISTGAVREEAAAIDGNPLNLRVSRLSPHPVTAGLESFSVYGAWALLPREKGIVAIAETGPRAWVDLNHTRKRDEGDAEQAFALAVAGERGKGSFVVIGDDAAFQNRFLVGDNLKLARNLARWLAGSTPDALVAAAR